MPIDSVFWILGGDHSRSRASANCALLGAVGFRNAESACESHHRVFDASPASLQNVVGFVTEHPTFRSSFAGIILNATDRQAHAGAGEGAAQAICRGS